MAGFLVLYVQKMILIAIFGSCICRSTSRIVEIGKYVESTALLLEENDYEMLGSKGVRLQIEAKEYRR